MYKGIWANGPNRENVRGTWAHFYSFNSFSLTELNHYQNWEH